MVSYISHITKTELQNVNTHTHTHTRTTEPKSPQNPKKKTNQTVHNQHVNIFQFRQVLRAQLNIERKID